MIKTVTIINHLGEAITLELRFPEKSGFLIREGGIDGLGPPKANINSTELATYDGSMVNSARVNSRNIVFSLGFLPSPTIEDTRQKSYKYFPIKKNITILVETDNRISETNGYVESNDLDIFSKEEGAVISVICPDSYFYSVNLDDTVFNEAEPAFTFPFSNDSLTEKLISFGEIYPTTERSIVYAGDASIGINIYIHAIGPAHNLRISNSRTQEIMRIDSARLIALTESDIIKDDNIIISTVKGNKFVYLQRGNTWTNILNCLDKNTDWFELEKGGNLFAYAADTGTANLEISIQNQTAYEGV